MTDSEMMPPYANDRTVVVRLPGELHEAVRARAKAEDRSVAATVRLALRRYVEPPAFDPANHVGGTGGNPSQAFLETFADPVTFGPVAGVEGEIVGVDDRPLMDDHPKPILLDPDVLKRAKAKPTSLGRGQDNVPGSPPPAAVKGTPEKCLHPVTRRLGKRCGACGETVGK